MVFSNTFHTKGRMLTGLLFALPIGPNFLKNVVMSESLDVSGSLLFVKDSLIKFVSSRKQTLLSFRILIGISPVDALSENFSEIC